MKTFIFLCLLTFATACAAPAEPINARNLPPDVQLSADAINARQTSDAALAAAQIAQSQAAQAKARAEQYSAQQTAIAQSTRDAVAYESTRVALQIQLASVTRQAALDNATATESARRVNVSIAETSQARQETRAAAQTQTRRADDLAAQSASQTRIAAYPTQTRIAEQIALEQTERERAAKIRAAQAEWDARVIPFINIGWAILPFLLVCIILFGILFSLWKLFRALEDYIRAKSLEVSAPALAQMQIRDAAGRPIGYLHLQNGIATFQPYFDASDDEPQPPQLPARSVIPLTDMQDRRRLETGKSPTESAALSSQTSTRGILTIHESDLRVFLQTILDSGDWSQTTWADKTLPRGFVLSKDTEVNGERVYGGYAQLMQLLVDKNLIIGRRQGRSGDWNPHAPRDAERIIAIIKGHAAIPPSPEEAARRTPSPTPTFPSQSIA
jgi:hypothetical protein